MSSPEAHPAKDSQSPENAEACRMIGQIYASTSAESPTNSTQQLSFGKMFQESSPPKTTPSEISWPEWLEQMPHSYRQKNAEGDGQTRVWLMDPGEPQLGVSSTLNISDSPNDAVVCSLSHVLIPAEQIPSKYFLSRKACAGILRRAAKRGKELPPRLKAALQRVADSEQISQLGGGSNLRSD
jgi:hypothetical protein